MNTRKLFICMLLIFCLVVPTWAHASGDRAIARWGIDKGIDDLILWQFVRGDELVLVGEEALYTYRLEEEQLHTFPWANGSMGAVSTQLASGSVFRSESTATCLASYVDGEDIYLVTPGEQNAILSRVELKNDLAYLEAVGSLDWESLDDSDEGYSMEYAVHLNTCAYADGYLYGYTTALEYAVAIPIDGGKTEILWDISNVECIFPYKDNRVVFVLYDTMRNGDACFLSWDMQNEELEELGRIPIEDISAPAPVGVAYDWEADRFIFNYGNAVCTLDSETGEVIVLNESYTNGRLGSVFPGGYYVCTDESGTLLRSTEPNTTEIRQLKIREIPWVSSEAINTVKDDYAFGRSDVTVTIYPPEEYSTSGLVEEMLTQSSDYDIYLGSLAYAAVDAAYNRGYMYAITESEKINALLSEMRPVFADALRVDGAPIAIPLDTHGSTVAIRLDALEQAGLTLEDIPTNWLDLLDALPNLYAKLQAAGAGLVWNTTTVEEIKSELADLIFMTYKNYAQYMQDNNPQAPVDIQPLRAVLEKLDSMDLNMFIKSGDEYNNGRNETFLLDRTWFLISKNTDPYPLVMSMTPDDPPLLPVSLDVAFINPYSQNKDLAVEFLEQTIECLDRAIQADLLSEDIEPKRTSGYTYAKARAEQDLADAKAALAQAGEGDNIEHLAREVGYAEENLADVEAHYWDFYQEPAQWYRSHADSIIVLRNNMLSEVLQTPDASETSLVDLYTQGQVSGADLVAIIEHKLQMMLMEGN